jgi:hypothetical protein
MHPIIYEIEFKQRTAELRDAAELHRRIALLPKRRRAKSAGRKVANAILVRAPRRA